MADKQIYKIDDELLSVLRKELLEDDSFQRLRTIQCVDQPSPPRTDGHTEHFK